MHADSTDTVDVADQIAAFKRSLAPRRAELQRAFVEAKDHIARAVDAIQADAAAGRPVVPEIDYRHINDGLRVRRDPRGDSEDRAARSCAGSSRNRSPAPGLPSSASISTPTATSSARSTSGASTRYFAALKAGRPQIFNVYWSKPQVHARQDPKLAETRAFLNHLWRHEGLFDPDRECTYADRVRRRQPGDETLGLSPHMDAGTVERWIDPGFQRVYGHVFAGNWRAYDPFDGTHRLKRARFPRRPCAACSARIRAGPPSRARAPTTARCGSSPSPRGSHTCFSARCRTMWRKPIFAAPRRDARLVSARSGTLS